MRERLLFYIYCRFKGYNLRAQDLHWIKQYAEYTHRRLSKPNDKKYKALDVLNGGIWAGFCIGDAFRALLLGSVHD